MKLGLLTALLSISSITFAQTRSEVFLKKWNFSRDGKTWKQVSVPHDWAIDGPFDKKWDIQYLAIVQDGQEDAMAHTGRSGGLPWLGEGRYTTTFNKPQTAEKVILYFDGAMSEPKVYVNGHFAGKWMYGYNAFKLDITPLVKAGQNSVYVHLNNVEESSRWYPGAGIYRPVKVVFSNKVSIDDWETFFRTSSINKGTANVTLDTRLSGADKFDNTSVLYTLYDAKGKAVSQNTSSVASDGKVSFAFNVPNANLWSIDNPYLYTLKVQAIKDKKTLDNLSLKVGIRTINITKEQGFTLNGVPMKFQGVCLHHDLGALGAALNKTALIRQIKMMKDMGVNAIRTSHNMPSQMQMDVCDSLGMMVMAESFDAWKELKVKNGYGRFYDEWWRKDLENLIKGHRNHPSIVMWSIGNEIPEQSNKQGTERAKAMTEFCHSLDNTRTVTCGVDAPKQSVDCGFYNELDVPGFNYRINLYEELINKLPHGFLLGSETTSTVSSRGVYKFPVTVEKMKTYDDGQCSSYDTECCGWSNLPDDDFAKSDDLAFNIGQFIWTGQDYLGEPTPYYSYWPSRSSYFGAVDLAGLPKDRFYLYRSVWNKKEQTLHLLPHWNWEGREGKVTPVYCYTSYPSAELFINGRSMGRIEKNKASRLDRYRLRWNDVTYEPGELKVVAYDEKGNKAAEKIVRTAGDAYALTMKPERNSIVADGEDLAYITLSMVDKNGNECPNADHLVSVNVSGAGEFKALCNGDATSLEPFTQPQMKLFHGKLVQIVQSNGQKGNIVVKVKTNNGIENTITLKAKK